MGSQGLLHFIFEVFGAEGLLLLKGASNGFEDIDVMLIHFFDGTANSIVMAKLGISRELLTHCIGDTLKNIMICKRLCLRGLR